jgi:hypothetical protein
VCAAAALTACGSDGEPTIPLGIGEATPTTDPGVVVGGIRWATRNVDAPGTFTAQPADAGMFYQWNRKVGWSSTDPMVSTNGDTIWDTSYSSDTAWAAANNPCPAGWRLPTTKALQS